MPSPFQRLVESLRDSTARLDTPPYRDEAYRQDLNPRNLYDIDREMQRTPPAQQDALAQERKRISDLQTRQIMQAAQTFQPRLAQRLQLPQMPPAQGMGQTNSVADLMMRMQMMGQRPPINGSRGMWQFNQERHDQPFMQFGGVRG